MKPPRSTDMTLADAPEHDLSAPLAPPPRRLAATESRRRLRWRSALVALFAATIAGLWRGLIAPIPPRRVGHSPAFDLTCLVFFAVLALGYLVERHVPVAFRAIRARRALRRSARSAGSHGDDSRRRFEGKVVRVSAMVEDESTFRPYLDLDQDVAVAERVGQGLVGFDRVTIAREFEIEDSTGVRVHVPSTEVQLVGSREVRVGDHVEILGIATSEADAGDARATPGGGYRANSVAYTLRGSPEQPMLVARRRRSAS